MSQQPQYETTGSSAQEAERLNKLEAVVRRILNLQRIDDLTVDPSAFARSTQSNHCNFSGLSTGGCAPGANFKARE
jgi:hypothetical protein